MHSSTLLLRGALRRQTTALLINNNVSFRQHSSDAKTTIPSQPDSVIPNSSNTNWTTIYKFPYISAIVRLNRVKVYQAAFTSIGVPVCMALESTEILWSGSTQIFAALGELIAQNVLHTRMSEPYNIYTHRHHRNHCPESGQSDSWPQYGWLRVRRSVEHTANPAAILPGLLGPPA